MRCANSCHASAWTPLPQIASPVDEQTEGLVAPNLVLRNEVANLAQNVKPGLCWFVFLFFMPAMWRVQIVKQALFSIS
jgi:hypothetical protein